MVVTGAGGARARIRDWGSFVPLVHIHRSRWGESHVSEREHARARERERPERGRPRLRVLVKGSSRVRQGFASERTSKGWKSRERGRSGAKPQQMSTSSGTIPSESCNAEPSAVPSAMSIRPRYAIDMAA